MQKQNQVVGTQSFYSATTGEIIEMQLMETDVPERDSNFHKLFLGEFTSALKYGGEGIGNNE